MEGMAWLDLIPEWWQGESASCREAVGKPFPTQEVDNLRSAITPFSEPR